MTARARTLTLRRAIVLVVVLGLLIPALLISGYSWARRYQQDVRKQTEELLLQNAGVVANGMQEPLWNINPESGNALLEAMMSRNEDIVRIDVRDNTLGVFVADERPERRSGFTASTERPVIYRGSTIGSVRIEVGSARLRRDMLQGLLESTAAVVAQASLSIALILVLLERRLVRPLQRLGAGAERLAARRLDEPFSWQRPDEIGLLARRLEDTRISLRGLFDELDRKNRELEEDIDKRKRVEQELHEREERFRALVEQSPIAIIEWNERHQVIEWNAAAERIFGHARAQAIGRHASFIVPQATREAVDAAFHGLAAARDSRHVSENLRADGQIISCQWSHTHIRDESGRSGRLLSIAEDITEQRMLEQQKAEADRALLRLAQGTRDIAGESFFELLVADLASALRADCAFIALRVRGTPHRLRTVAAHLHGQAMKEFEYDIAGTPSEHTLEGELYVVPSDLRQRFPDGPTGAEYGWESYAGAPLRDSAGNAIGVLAVLHAQAVSHPDLVKSLLQVFSERAAAELERKRAEEELRTSEQRFITIFESSPIAMFVTQVRGNYVVRAVNRAFEQLFLRSRESVLGKNTGEIGLYCDPADRAALIAELKQTGATDSRPELWMYRSDGSRVLVQLSGHTFVLAGDKFGILACTDVTGMRRIEGEIRELNATLEQRVIERTEELQQANRELEQTLETLHKAQEELVRSEKLAALGSLVAGIAHELNTPIGNSLMVASTLLDQTCALNAGYAKDGGIRRSALEHYLGDAGSASDILVRNLQRAAGLVASFKQVAVDQTSSHRRRFSVAEVVSEIMLTLWPTLRKASFSVRQDIPAELAMDSYPGPLGQVITNLVNNALLHGFEGRSSGTVLISARESDDGWLEFTVQDDGVGIPVANLNRIFDPFFTTRMGSGGTGLGLNITHNIVTGILGGRIRVQSEPDRGSAFILSLPLVAPQRQAEDD